MKIKKIPVIIGAVVVMALGLTSVTVTAQNEYKLIRQFGKVKRVIDKPGLSLRIPFLETAATLPKKHFCTIWLRLMLSQETRRP